MIDELWGKAVRILQQDYPSTVEDLLVADAASSKIQALADQERFLEGDSFGSSLDLNDYWPDPGTTPD